MNDGVEGYQQYKGCVKGIAVILPKVEDELMSGKQVASRVALLLWGPLIQRPLSTLDSFRHRQGITHIHILRPARIASLFSGIRVV